MSAFCIILFLVGFALSMYSTVLFLIRAFTTSIGWGVVTLVVPFGNVLFTLAHWTEGRRPFFAWLLAIALFAGGIGMAPEVRASIRNHTTAGLFAASHQDNGEDLNQEVNNAREDGIRLQEHVDSETKELTAAYAALAKKKAQLKPGDQESISAFNAEAARYTARKTQLDLSRKQLKENADRLSSLLAKRAGAVATTSGTDSGDVVIFGTTWCPACKEAKAYLDARGVPYREIDVEHSDDGAREFRERGGTAVPLIVMNGDQMTGFSSQWVDAHLRR
jgi:glutaredoxin